MGNVYCRHSHDSDCSLPTPMARVSSHQIADLLANTLETVFDGLSTQRYGKSISLWRAKRTSPSSPVTFQLERPERSPIEAHVTIQHIGGNVYDLTCTVDGGPTRSFTYSLPDLPAHEPAKVPGLSREVALFLLDALEQRLGSDLLRGKTHGADSGEALPPPSSS